MILRLGIEFGNRNKTCFCEHQALMKEKTKTVVL